MKQLQSYFDPMTLRYSIGIWMAVLLARPLLSHRSSPATWFGLYSTSYLILVVFCALLTVAWVLAFLLRPRVQFFLERLSPTIKHIAMWGVVGFGALIWLPSGEITPKAFIALNCWGVLLILVCAMPDRPVNIRVVLLVLLIAIGIVLGCIFITNMTSYAYSPDEALWADYGSTLPVRGGIYARTWAMEPTLIRAGLPWSVGLYGWLLETVSFDIKTGRVWTFVWTILTLGALGLFARKLYNSATAIVAILFASMSMAFFHFAQFRPDYLTSLVAPLAAWCILKGRDTTITSKRFFWFALCGLVCTLSLNLHAVGIVASVAFSLFMIVLTVQEYFSQRQWAWLPLIAFGVGSGLGTLVFVVANILPTGGLQAFLDVLFAERFGEKAIRNFNGFFWSSMFEVFIVLLGYAYLIWRHESRDRFLLMVSTLMIVCGLILDSQGYSTPYRGLHIIPLAVFFVDGLRQPKFTRGRNFRMIIPFSALLLFMMAFQVGEQINWREVSSVLRTGQVSIYPVVALAETFASEIQTDDTLVTTQEFIWTLHDIEKYYAPAAEIRLMQRFNLRDAQAAWEFVSPTVIVHLRDQMEITAGLQAYMDDQNFRICQTYNAAGLTADLYRVNC